MRTFATVVLMLALVACAKEKSPDAAAPVSATPTTSGGVPMAPPTPATVALADMKHLRYLTGKWRGQGATGAPFYERYAFVNDSTIQTFTLTDSTFKTVADSGLIRWSNGAVHNGSPGKGRVATIWTADSVRFDPEKGATNSFTWIRKSADAWEARLESQGSTTPTIYTMTRVKE